MPTRRRNRKRNKSSPLVQSSPKKSKSHQTDSDTDHEPVQDITEAESSTELESDNESQSQSILKTPVSVKPLESTDLNTTMQNLDSSLVIPGSGSNSGETQTQTQNISQAQMMNPVLFSSQMNLPNSQQQPQLLAYQGPLQHPVISTAVSSAMPAASGLSEQDVIRIAQLVKSMLHEEITQIVQINVTSATAALQTELSDVKAKCKKLEDEVLVLQTKYDDIEQYSRRMCLRISGIAETEREDINKIVLDFAARVNANVGPEDIDRAHRVGKVSGTNENNGARATRSREIIIKFTNSTARLSLLKGRAKLREQNVRNIYINEDLTPARKQLAYECRRIKRLRSSKIKKTWVFAGYPHILDDSGNRVKITCLSDLDNYQVTDAAQAMNT